MTDWQPIETAPKDGRMLLLVWRDKQQQGLPMVLEGYWYAASDGEAFWWSPGQVSWKLEPTHWMPLPKPPEVSP